MRSKLSMRYFKVKEGKEERGKGRGKRNREAKGGTNIKIKCLSFHKVTSALSGSSNTMGAFDII
jgi:hypothetical protein